MASLQVGSASRTQHHNHQQQPGPQNAQARPCAHRRRASLGLCRKQPLVLSVSAQPLVLMSLSTTFPSPRPDAPSVSAQRIAALSLATERFPPLSTLRASTLLPSSSEDNWISQLAARSCPSSLTLISGVVWATPLALLLQGRVSPRVGLRSLGGQARPGCLLDARCLCPSRAEAVKRAENGAK